MFYKILNLDELNDFIQEDKKCRNCKTTLSIYKKTGKFGCSECYKTFEDEINNTLTRVYGDKAHKGKIPKSYKVFEEENISLEKRLKYALEKEDYIEAARLRDLLKEKCEKG